MPHVQVVIRCRPPLSGEQHMKCTRVEANETNNTIAVNSSKQDTAKSFSFDRVLSESSTQEDVFETISPMVEHALDGMHATVFAYGQTGSGKTHTIEGIEYGTDSAGKLRPRLDTPHGRHGVLPRVIQAVFDRCRDRVKSNQHVQFRLKCSFLQLYNEKVSDLLNPSTRALKEGLKIRWSRNDHFEVENLFVFECDSADQMREMFLMGVKEKVMSSHQMNHQSSRSHCIFTIHVHSWDPHNPESVLKSELSVVDLAGSEKLALLSSNPTAQLLKESIEINTSLLSLGKVITALAAAGKGGINHVPYRDSKLTKLLKHALGGNSMTSMIACVSPLDDYLSTLMYAGRARNITTVPKINEDPRSALIRQLRDEIASLKSELEYYKQLAGTGDGSALATRIDAVFGSAGAATSGQPSLSSSSTGKKQDGQSSPIDEAQQADLAEKLLASCKMLKNVVGVNNQLRVAFDKLKVAKEASDQREVELNAENLALRERIEMLESIALNGDDNNGTPPNTSAAAYTNGASSSAVSRSQNNNASFQRAAAPQQNSDVDLLSVYGQRNSNNGPQHANSVYPQPSASVPYRQEPPQPPTRPMNDRLRDYTTKYRNPQQPTRYEDYYGAAKKVTSSSQGTKVVEELDRLMKNIPKTTQQMVPVSLSHAHAYGSLSFGGTDAETRDLEERRRARQQKMKMLQDQHDHMQKGFSGGVGPGQPPASHQPSQFASSAGSYGLSDSLSGALRPSRGGIPVTSYSGPPSLAGTTHAPPPPLEFSASPGSGSNRLFQYLSNEETSHVFTAEQQERLRMRGGGSNVPSTVPSQSGLQNASSAGGLGSGRGGASPRIGGTAASALQRQLDQIASMRR
ncbi:kinesin, putative [Bodo saltans]|uniref:Kinesin-like protein n=1 Tax=Bodo saltans TaxID=75058 RepID=A0A0S4ILK1_BODSA|nr:kinesin, putative [Bodo saltans]|eukprot:CUE71547.1 kinesin, putative [Bodo saltans]